MPGWLHIIVAMVAGAVVGGALGRDRRVPEGDHGRQRGDLDDHAQLHGALHRPVLVRDQGGPLHSSDPANASIPVSNDVFEDTQLPVFWGDPVLQGLHIGIFIAARRHGALLGAAQPLLTGYEVRAVGYNPDAAEYGGISAGRNYVKVMLICGAFAGLAGAIDVLGWQFRIATIDVQVSLIGFTASRWRCSAATPRSARRSPRCCSPRC